MWPGVASDVRYLVSERFKKIILNIKADRILLTF